MDQPEKLRQIVTRCIREALITAGPGGWHMAGPMVKRALIAERVLGEIGLCEEAGSRTWETASTLALIVARLNLEEG